MKKILIILCISACGLSLFADSEPPDWANKQGAFGIGLSATLGGLNNKTPEFDQSVALRYTGFGVQAGYNVLSFINLNAIVGFASSKSVTEYEDSEYSNTARGLNLNLRVLSPMFGGNGFLTPDCNSSIIASPFIGFNYWSGSEEVIYDGSGGTFDYDEDYDFTHTTINIGTRVEYFLPDWFNLQTSVQLNLNFVAFEKTTYEEDYEDYDDKTTVLFNTSPAFGNVGFTFWF